ncbi:MAG: efflux RND transporter periplasmic adaptor subunit [bacterium]|nr:efflux RND transporter periplasmic adaptor subunit [bacterium]
MKKTVKYILPVLIVLVAAGTGLYLIKSSPKAERRRPKVEAPVVEVLDVAPEDYRVQLKSRGTVTPRTESTLIPEVAGRVISISANFRDGGFFEKGDELLQIDPGDYELAVTTAMADEARMLLALREEEARSLQAKRDWERLGISGKAGELVLRAPQLASARAALDSARAILKQARVDLERTRIKAPYAGRIVQKNVDVGQYVSPGTPLAKIFAIDYLEVRLPLTDHQLAYVDLPETYRGGKVKGRGTDLLLTSDIGGRTFSWKARLVRTEAAIDVASRQLFVIAQVADPYKDDGSGRPQLKIGQFVQASIEGHLLKDVFVIPRDVISGTNMVLTLGPESRIKRREVEVVWRDKKFVVVKSGLSTGDRVISTRMPYAVENSPVRLHSETAPEKKVK